MGTVGIDVGTKVGEEEGIVLGDPEGVLEGAINFTSLPPQAQQASFAETPLWEPYLGA